MKAWLLDKVGTHQNMYIGNIPAPEPKAGELKVRVKAAGLNPVDYKLAARGWPTWEYPHVLGLDVAGEVNAVGDGVTHYKTGDRIYYHGDLSKPGGFAEEAIVDARVVAAIPGNMTYETAAALPCAGFTAYQAVYDRLDIRVGQSLFVWGSGAVGGFGIQLAKIRGARIIATCEADTEEHVRSLGADVLIDYKTKDVVKTVREITEGRGVEKALNTISEETATQMLLLLSHHGAMASTQGRPDWKALENFTIAPTFHEISLGSAFVHGGKKGLDRISEIGYELGTLVARGKIEPMITSIISFEDIPAGLDKIASGQNKKGKIVVKF